MELCASAFPDILPWQVQMQLSSVDDAPGRAFEKEKDDAYYLYLSRLLHPIDGHEIAKKDKSLVKVS